MVATERRKSDYVVTARFGVSGVVDEPQAAVVVEQHIMGEPLREGRGVDWFVVGAAPEPPAPADDAAVERAARALYETANVDSAAVYNWYPKGQEKWRAMARAALAAAGGGG